jgi:two-component system, chemotaxis family, CheB/CheR fusion protein
MATRKKSGAKRGAARRKTKPARETRAPESAAPTQVSEFSSLTAPRTGMPVVGVGASAGGLEAFSQLLVALPEKPGMAIVLVQHLAPQHESALPTLLGNVSSMPVVQVTDAMHVEVDHVYVIPPNAQLTLVDGELRLAPRSLDRMQYNPIDLFFRSLADSAGECAIGVVLSGTASDGSAGIREVKAAGGITIAQTPESAKYDGMPRSAIATGMVDLVLSPAEIAAALVAIGRHPYVRAEKVSDMPLEVMPTLAHLSPAEEQMQRIFGHLRSVSGVDFKQYKLPTIVRRLHRRMALHKLTQIRQYLEYVDQNPGEVHELYSDLLIHVTRFFREPDSFQALRTTVLPEITGRRGSEVPIRIWVCGCATGEEAYSIAILLVEFLGDDAGSVPIQIFATDVAEPAIEHARSGIYPETIAVDVSPERLRRFFTKVDGGYRVSKGIRDLCVFARQDLTRDPPFSKLDLVLCRNVLIYMTAPLQRTLMAVFHYALKPTGFLMLGHAETIGPHSDLFIVTDKRNRIYSRKPTETSPAVSFPVDHSMLPVAGARAKPTTAVQREDSRSIQAEANRIVLDRYGPPGVIVDHNLQVVQFRGQTGPYLEPPPGDPSLSLLKMTREGLLYGMRTALHAARKGNGAVRLQGLRVRYDNEWRDVVLEVLPLTWRDRGHFLVLFRESSRDAPRGPSASDKKKQNRKPRAVGKGASAEDFHVSGLQQELAASREYLQSIIQEVEAANEELQSANEEILSSNEELQSTNEELDTAKEELQSTNEELNTVNEELHGRNEELSRANSDLVNLLGSVEIAIVIVANDLRIRRFTPMAERVLNLIPTDIGRPISHIKPNIDCANLEQLISEAVDRVAPQEIEVQDRQGNWYSLRIRPYKNVDNRIDGAVLSLFDVNAARQHEREISQARQYTRAVLDAVQHPMVLVDRTHMVRWVNDKFLEVFGLHQADVDGKSFFSLSDGAWNVPELRSALDTQVAASTPAMELDLVSRFHRRGTMRLRVGVWRIDGAAELEPMVLLSIEHMSPSEPRAG